MPYGDAQNGEDLAFFVSQVINCLSWREPLVFPVADSDKFDDEEIVYIKVMQSLYKLSIPVLQFPNPDFLPIFSCQDSAAEDVNLHDQMLHDPYGHVTVFWVGNKANVAGEKFSSDAFIHN